MLAIIFFVISGVIAYVTSSCKEVGEFDPKRIYGPVELGVESAMAKIYKYPSKQAFWDTGFLPSEYKKYPVIDRFFVSDINFNSTSLRLSESKNSSYNIYGHEIPEAHVLEVSGYFKANETGYFEFEFGAYNGGSLELGPGQLRCGDRDSGGRRGFHMEASEPMKQGLHFEKVAMKTGNWCFTRGIYYPVKIVLYNTRDISGLKLKVKLPSGKTLRDFGPEIFQAKFKCYTTTTSVWTETFSSSTTQTGSSTDIVIVHVPKATTTTTTTWSKPYRSTSTITGESTNTVIVDIPKPVTTTTSVWSATTTSITTATGTTDTVIVHIPRETTTITSTWGSSYTTTTTDAGLLTVTVVVDIPTPTETTTRMWTGSYTTSTTITGGTGENNTLVIEIPHWLTTTTSTWTGSDTSTTTEIGSETDTIIVEVPTPTETTTRMWTGSYTTSTTITGGTGENNTLVIEIPHWLTTTTSTWTGSDTSTTTEIGSETDTIIVELPTPIELPMRILTENPISSNNIVGGSKEKFSVERPNDVSQIVFISSQISPYSSIQRSASKNNMPLSLANSFETGGSSSSRLDVLPETMKASHFKNNKTSESNIYQSKVTKSQISPSQGKLRNMPCTRTLSQVSVNSVASSIKKFGLGLIMKNQTSQPFILSEMQKIDVHNLSVSVSRSYNRASGTNMSPVSSSYSSASLTEFSSDLRQENSLNPYSNGTSNTMGTDKPAVGLTEKLPWSSGIWNISIFSESSSNAFFIGHDYSVADSSGSLQEINLEASHKLEFSSTILSSKSNPQGEFVESSSTLISSGVAGDFSPGNDVASSLSAMITHSTGFPQMSLESDGFSRGSRVLFSLAIAVFVLLI